MEINGERERDEKEAGKQREPEIRTLGGRRSLHCFLFSLAHTHTHTHTDTCTEFPFSAVVRGSEKEKSREDTQTD